MAIILKQPDPIEKPSWFTPSRLLIIFCIVNLLNYVDRGAIASNGVNGVIANSTCNPHDTCFRGSGIQGDFQLSYFEDGVLSSAFMVGLLVASPIFAHLAKTCNPFRLIGVGLSVWTIATAACGFSIDFWSITIARMLVGVGEASFISLAAPYVVDNAPVEKRTAWLSIFYMCIPVGMALGYVYGGLVGGLLNWRVAFWGEAFLMLPFAVFGFISRPITMKGFNARGEHGDPNSIVVPLSCEDEVDSVDVDACDGLFASGQKRRQNLSDASKLLRQQVLGFGKDIKTLFLNRVYTINVLGYIAFNFVLGAYSYWGPKAGHAIYDLDNADLVFGGLTIICGVIGTIAGGFILDYVGSTITNGFKLLSVATLVGGVACFVSFISKKLALFIPLFAVGELFIFATQGPVNYVTLQCVPLNLRPLSMAVSTVCIHVFGDVPSSPLVGALQDHLNNWRTTTLILTTIFFLATIIWSLGVFFPTDDQTQGGEDVNIGMNQKDTQQAPLLVQRVAAQSVV